MPSEPQNVSVNCIGTAGPRRWLSVLVPLHVQGQVVGAGEAAVTHSALERLGPSVLPVMARQLIRACEPPVAAIPGAFVRLLTCDNEGRRGEVPACQTNITDSAWDGIFLKITVQEKSSKILLWTRFPQKPFSGESLSYRMLRYLIKQR